MIKLIPLEKSSELEELCKKYNVAFSDNIHAYISADKALKAQCIFSLDGYNVELLAIDFDDFDPLIAEMLIRAVGSYAANRSGYIFSVSEKVGQDIDSTLKTMNFEKNNGVYSGKVPKILEGTCCHKDKK